MRLWHQALIPHLPNKQLLGQHRECCALRGKGWGRKHSTVDYVFTHPKMWLFQYHLLVMNEMYNRRFYADPKWFSGWYCGDSSPHLPISELLQIKHLTNHNEPIYPEHDNNYLQECITNLKEKGIHLTATQLY